MVAVVIILKLYDHNILNIFDELILQLLVLVTLIPLADNVSQQLSTTIIIIAIILPQIFFISLELIVHKEAIKTITTEQVSTSNNSNEAPMRTMLMCVKCKYIIVLNVHYLLTF